MHVVTDSPACPWSDEVTCPKCSQFPTRILSIAIALSFPNNLHSALHTPLPAMLLAHLSSGDPAVPNTSNQCNEDVLEPLRVCQMHPGRVPQHLLIMHVRPRKVVPIVQLDPCAASAPHTSRRRRFSTTQWCIATFDVRPACHSYSRVAMHSAHEPITTIVYIRLELTIFERNCKVAAKLLQCLRLHLIM